MLNEKVNRVLYKYKQVRLIKWLANKAIIFEQYFRDLLKKKKIKNKN